MSTQLSVVLVPIEDKSICAGDPSLIPESGRSEGTKTIQELNWYLKFRTEEPQ